MNNVDMSRVITAEQKAQAALPAPDRDLSKVEFEYLLALTGLDDVWGALEAALKDTDRATYAAIRSQRVQTNFRQATTLGFVAQLRDLAATVAPAADLSDSAIIAAWETVALA